MSLPLVETSPAATNGFDMLPSAAHRETVSDHKENVTGFETFVQAPPPVRSEEIREVLLHFLTTLNIPYRCSPYDNSFGQQCIQEALSLGLPSEVAHDPAFKLALHGAVAIAVTTYRHLEDKATQRWIALYTTCLIFFDDLSVTDPTSVKEFHQRFTTATPQLHPLLDLYSTLLRRSWERFSPCCSNLIVSSSLDFISGLILDYDLKDLKVHPQACQYPRYIRTVMGVSTAFVVFTFPPSIPLADYIQVLPDMVNYIDDVNDLFSFYKEEKAGEDTNHISLLAKLDKKTKLEAMRSLAEKHIQGSFRTREILSSANPLAVEIYLNHFLPGYVEFHATASKRYLLDDLDLEDHHDNHA